MNHLLIPLITLSMLCYAAVASAEIVTKQIDYMAGGTQMSGWMAYDDAATSKQPGILVVHEWWGNNDYSKMRAQQLAKLGYVAFAIDMYGKGKTTDDPKEAGEWSGNIKKDTALQKERFTAGMTVLTSQPNVDTSKIGAIGYCFGGGCVLNAARWNLPIKAVVSFHGDLSTTEPAKKVDAKILVCTGSADAFVPPAAVEQFKKEMAAAHADVKVIEYPGAHHAFTNPEADSHHMDNIKYDPEADKKSWQDMKDFFAGVF